MNLYPLRTELQALRERMKDDGLDAVTITDTINSLALPFEEKAVGLAMISDEMNVDADAAEAFFKAGLMRVSQLREKADKLRTHVIDNMLALDLKEITHELRPVKLAKNPAAVVIDDEKALPPSYWRTPEPKPPVASPDKKAIKEAIDKGIDVPGARLLVGWRLK